jgi:hypothetical protein
LPGTYTIRLTLDDSAEGARADEAAIPLVVVAVAVSASAEGSTPELTAVDQDSGPAGAILLWPLAGLGGLLALVALGVGARVVRRRRAGVTHR